MLEPIINWQPIETAPDHPQMVLVGIAGQERIHIASRTADGLWTNRGTQSAPPMDPQPTHWALPIEPDDRDAAVQGDPTLLKGATEAIVHMILTVAGTDAQERSRIAQSVTEHITVELVKTACDPEQATTRH